MAETEDCKVFEVATIEEKSEWGMSSYQDPSTPDHNGTSHNNQTNDLKNYYVVDSSSVSPDSITLVDCEVPEVATTEDKSESDMSSYQDPSTPDHNRTSQINQNHDLKNSYVADRSSVSPESVTPVDDQGIELDSQNELDVEDMKVSKSPIGIVMVGQIPCFASHQPTKHASYLEDVDKLLMPVANSLETIDVNNDDESRNLLDKEDVEDTGDQFDTASHCYTEISFQTENERTGNDDAVCNKNIDQGIELDSQNERLDVVDWEGSEPLNVEENGEVMGLDFLENFPPLMSHNRREIKSDVAITFGTTISYNSEVNHNDDELKTENEQTGDCDIKGKFVASPENCSIEALKKPLNFLIKIPRVDDEILIEQIRLSKLHVDEKVGLRDAIQVQIREKVASNQIHVLNYESAKNEVRCARDLVKSKYMEIDSLQSVIDRARTALSIEDINSQISNMDYRMQHKTITLKEEKQLLREIKQLKQAREQISSNIGSEDEYKQAVQKREEAEECLKTLRKDLNILKNGVSKAEATAARAMKKYHDEKQMLMNLQTQFRAADKVQQEAYIKFRNLREELSKKEKQFFKYKNDGRVANNYALNKDTMVLHSFCSNQVENFMNLWNTNEEYRREYTRNNARSTVRRFGTLDGRALGHGEKPPVLPVNRVSRVVSAPVKAVPAPQIPIVEVKQETTNGNLTLRGKSSNEVTKSKNISKRTINEVDEKPVESKDEVESLRKDEEVTKEEEDEAKLKEQRRAEEMAKANEALKRKKREAERKQMREELKAQKEAEEREKKREKRRRKKEKKNAGSIYSSSESGTAICEDGDEKSEDVRVKEMPSVAPQKPRSNAKKCKTEPIPPVLLRNRKKRRMQQWMWVAITSFIFLVLFLVGEYNRIRVLQ